MKAGKILVRFGKDCIKYEGELTVKQLSTQAISQIRKELLERIKLSERISPRVEYQSGFDQAIKNSREIIKSFYEEE